MSERRSRGERVQERLDSAMPWIAASLVGAFLALDVFANPPWLEGNEDRAILAILGIVAVAIALQRRVVMERTLKRVDDLDQNVQTMLDESVDAVLLEGEAHVMARAREGITHAQKRVVALVRANEPRAEFDFIDAVARRVQDLKVRHGKRLKFEAHMACCIHDLPAAFFDAHAERLATFKDRGIDDRIDVFVIDFEEDYGFDFLVIDDRHVFLTLPEFGTDRPETVLYLPDNVAVASHLLSWLSALNGDRGATVDSLLKERLL